LTGKFDTNTVISPSIKPVGTDVQMVTKNVVPSLSSTKGWMYDSTNGAIYVNSTLKDSKQVPYSFYGFE
jgi:hypothetical protein